MKSSLRALAIDIDGTLINSSKQIPSFTRREIHRVVREYGVKVFLITARGPKSAGLIEGMLGVKCSIAAYGGAYVEARSGQESEVLFRGHIPEHLVTKVIEIARSYDVYAGVHTENDCFVNRFDYWARREARNTSTWPIVASDGPDGAPLPVSKVFKVMFRGESDVLSRLNADLTDAGRGLYAHHNNRVLEIVPAEAVKLPALSLLADFHALTLDQIVAFGDTEADVEMLEAAGVGALMANADESFEVLPTVLRTLSNDEDGIGVVLRELFPTDEPFLT